jgi:hypothetical protein
MGSADRKERKLWPSDLFSSSSWGSSTPTFADEDEVYPDRLMSCPDLSLNVGLCDSPSKWSFRPLIGCPQLVSRINVAHPAISQSSATVVDRVLAVRQRYVQTYPSTPVMTQNVGDGMPWFRHLFTCLALANRPPRPGPTCGRASQSGSNRTYCAPPGTTHRQVSRSGSFARDLPESHCARRSRHREC